jgi:hypothetical protein
VRMYNAEKTRVGRVSGTSGRVSGTSGTRQWDQWARQWDQWGAFSGTSGRVSGTSGASGAKDIDLTPRPRAGEHVEMGEVARATS